MSEWVPGESLDRSVVKRGLIGLTGGSGFLGRHVLTELRRQGYSVRLLLRSKAVPPPGALADPGISIVRGDLLVPEALQEFLAGTKGLIHLVGIIRERRSQGITFERLHVQGTQLLAAAAREAGIRRWIYVSAIGADVSSASRYFQSKAEAEKLVQAASLSWTIFRPSLIYGEGGEFYEMVRHFWCDFWPPWVPYFGSGLLGMGEKKRVQPVFAGDVARALSAALEQPATSGRIYEIGGPEEMTWPQMYECFRQWAPWRAIARRKCIAPVPAWLARGLASLPLLPLPFSGEQVLMSQQHSRADNARITRDCGWQPRPMTGVFS